VPEVSIHKYGELVTIEYEIRPTGQVANVRAEFQAAGVEQSKQVAFRTRVRSTNPAHQLAPFLGRHNVGHGFWESQYMSGKRFAAIDGRNCALFSLFSQGCVQALVDIALG